VVFQWVKTSQKKLSGIVILHVLILDLQDSLHWAHTETPHGQEILCICAFWTLFQQRYNSKGVNIKQERVLSYTKVTHLRFNCASSSVMRVHLRLYSAPWTYSMIAQWENERIVLSLLSGGPGSVQIKGLSLAGKMSCLLHRPGRTEG